MDYQHQVFTLIKRLTGQENILAVPKDIVRFAGDPATGMFLSQLIYWSDRGARKDGYIFKTYKEWEEELGIKRYYARKAKNNLEEMGIIETKVKKANGNPTVHYKLIKEEFVKQFIKFIENQEDKLNDSKVDITQKEKVDNASGKCNRHNSLTETTTEITNKEKTYMEPKRNSPAMCIFLDYYLKYQNEKHKAINESALYKVQSLLDSIYSEIEDEDIFKRKIQNFMLDYSDEDKRPTLSIFLSIAGRYFNEVAHTAVMNYYCG